MAQIPNLEMSLSIVDADKLLAEVRRFHDSAQRAYTAALAFWIGSVLLAVGIAIALTRSCPE